MLGYRMYVGAAGIPSLVNDVDERLLEWLNEKSWNLELPTEERPVWVAPSVRASVVSHVHSKGGVTRRHRFVEDGNAGRWVTELTVHQGAESSTGWIWLDVHRPPKGPNVQVPRLARRLLELIQATDGRFTLNPEPVIVERLQAEELVRRVADRRRRGLVFVAAEDPHKRDRFVLEDTVTRLTKGTVGAAAAFVLTADAATEFTATVGPYHEVAPGTLRTFLPGVEFGDRDDGLRHRFLTRQTVAASYERPGPTSRVLESRAREHALTTKLPPLVIQVDQLLRKKLDDLMLTPGPLLIPFDTTPDAASPSVPAPVDTLAPEQPTPRITPPTPLDLLRRGSIPSSAESPPTAAEHENTAASDRAPAPATNDLDAPAIIGASPMEPDADVDETSTDRGTESTARETASLAETPGTMPAVGPTPNPGLDRAETQIITDTLKRLFGTFTPTVDSVLQLCELAFTGQFANAARADLKTRISGLETDLEQSWSESEDLRDRLRQEQIDHGDATSRLRDLDRKYRFLQSRVAELGDPESAWATPVADPRDVPPEGYDELILRLDEFHHLEFTGDEEVVLDLGAHDSQGSWAKKAWDALLALDDFGRARLGGFSGSVDMYLSNPPSSDYRVFPANRHAADESEDVQKNPKFRNPRVLPVPPAVSAHRALFMGAHFKIAQSGLISPRMHYYDDTARTKKIYVGYIGPHLPTKQTN